MTNQDYIAGVLKTEAPITDELLARLRDPWALSELSDTLSSLVESGQVMNTFKRYVFYNKFNNIKPEIICAAASQWATRINGRTARLLHAVAGLHTEISEIAEAFDKYIFYTSSENVLDEVNLIEEVGDLFWYLALFCSILGVTFEDVMERNNRKLRARYGEKFSEEAATNRDLETERYELEQVASAESSSAFTLDDFRQITQRPAWRAAWQAVYRRDPSAEFGDFLPVDLPLLTRVAVAIEAAEGVIPV